MSAHPSAEQLSAFLDAELPEAERRALEDHLGTCDACAAHLADLAAVDEAARALPLDEPAGYFDDFAARVRARVVARPKARVLPAWTWAAAAAVLLAVVTPLALRERAAQAPAPAVAQDEAARAGATAAPVPAAAPPASAAKPQAAPAGADGARMTEVESGVSEARGRRANPPEQQDRLLRRDQVAPNAPPAELQASQDKREAPAPEPAPATPPPARLEEKAVDRMRTLGYAAPPPPATSQRPHGPHGQQQVASPPAVAPAPADIEVAESGAASAFRGEDLAKEKDDGAPRQKQAAASDIARSGAGGASEAAKRGAAAGAIMKAEPAPSRTGAEAREKREAFRRMALEDPESASADASRVGAIAEGVRAYRLEGRAEDRATAERDGRAYLARPDALQKPRVRALLRELSEPRS